MKRIFQSTVFITGLAIFAMFFGAGNLVFPLALGISSGSYVTWALLGFLCTAVAAPVLGLSATVLFDGDYKAFFYRLGTIPGFTLICIILALVGPFAVIPRCIALSHTTMHMFLPHLSLTWFTIGAVIVIFFFAIKENQLLTIFGKILSPIKLACLLGIIVLGFYHAPAALIPPLSQTAVFFEGLYKGYQTMDLLGGILFASLVVMLLQRSLHPTIARDYKKIAALTFRSGFLAAGLLAFIYGGFAIVASFWGPELGSLKLDETIGALAFKVLGNFGGIFASLAVSLTCLTTAITLTVIFAEFLQHDILRNKIPYIWSLVVTLIIAALFAIRGFEWIFQHVGPVLDFCYPAIIMLSIVNIAYKLYNFTWVKLPVALTFIATIIVLYFDYIVATFGTMLG